MNAEAGPVKSLRVIELPQILERLATYCAFGASAELARTLRPSPDPDVVIRRLQETTEARALLDQHPQMGIGGARDVRGQVQAAEKGAMLQPGDLLDIQATLLSARQLRRTVLRLEATFPRLAFVAGSLADLSALIDSIGRTVNPRGEIVDGASAELGQIRRELNVARSRLMERLQRILISPSYAKIIQEPIITQREGRYVIPVRAEARARLNGIVHDASASGATLFVEPLATVELGNQVRELQARETREVERILRELSGQVAAEADAVSNTVQALAELDLAFAKAGYAAALRATAPRVAELAPDRPFALVLNAARHPLLDPETVVPISLALGPSAGYSILIITGPNTGGKTVTLKTVGLMAAMAQCGLHLPVEEGSQLPVYQGIFADIGDEQSIEQSLSTFSSHLSNIVGILQSADENSLVLLDELGAGTDPVEGAALARAILEHLLARRISTLVATHYSELKAFAHTTAEVENASMEFDVETLRPTYHLQIGLPGRSNAFAIASRLGLAPEIIEESRALLTRGQVEFEDMLLEIRHAKDETAREWRRAEHAREQAESRAVDARRRLDEAERSRRDILAQARREAEGEVEAARSELAALRKEWRQVSITREFVEQAQEEMAAVAAKVEEIEVPPTPSAPPPDGEIGVGDKVRVPGLGTEGEVVAVSEEGVDVQLGAMRARLARDQVELRQKAARVAPQPASAVILPPAESPGVEIHLRGMRAEEALESLERYLDRAYLAGLPYVRVVHGKGTGTLRRLVRERLSKHPFVKEIRNAEAHEGAEGVTIAMLVSR